MLEQCKQPAHSMATAHWNTGPWCDLSMLKTLGIMDMFTEAAELLTY